MKCEICDREFDSVLALSKHLKTHGLKKQEYYEKFLKKYPDEEICKCGNKKDFFTINSGYKDFCEECSKLRWNNFKFWIIRYGMSEEEAKKEVSSRQSRDVNHYIRKFGDEEGKKKHDEFRKRTGKAVKKAFDSKLEDNPNANKERSHICPEFWIKKGLSEEETHKKLAEIRKSNSNKNSNTRQSNKHLYQDIIPTQLKYWLKKGFSEEEAREKVRERQITFSLEKCLEKYGEKEGNAIFRERQERWQNTLNNKPDEEKKRINLAKFTNCGYSKSSQLFFTEIYNKLEKELQEKTYFGNLNQEFAIYDSANKRYFLYDFVISNIKFCIEFNGEHVHPNPSMSKGDWDNWKSCFDGKFAFENMNLTNIRIHY